MNWVLEKVYNCDSAEVLAVYNEFDLQDATIEAKRNLGVQVKEEIMFWKDNYSGRGFKEVNELAEAEVLGVIRLHGMECDESLCENCKGVLMGLDLEGNLFYDKRCEVDWDPDDEDYPDPPESWFGFVHYDDDRNNQYFFRIGPLVLHLQYYRYYESDKVKVK